MFVETKETTVREIVHPCLPKWRARIDAAERRGSFDSDDEENAAFWDACACGEAFEICPSIARGIPKNRDGGRPPADARLYTLGMRFSRAVGSGNQCFATARKVLTAIEARLGEIL